MENPLDFFISYTRADERWAEWIAWQLEQAGYRTKLMAWDFLPGTSFPAAMQQALVSASRTLAVFSPAYLTSAFCAPEWEAVFVQDPKAERQKLLPVRIADCQPPDLLARLVYIDLVNLDEASAWQKLLAGVQTGRAKPSVAPAFPGPTAHGRTGGAPVYPGGLPPVWTVPYGPNPYFTGREAAMGQLERALTQGRKAAVTQVQAIHGLGGVGKTQMAVEYAYAQRHEYDAVLWVGSDSGEAMAANLSALAGAGGLGLGEGEAREQSVRVAGVLRWLREHERWLLVFDSADSREAVAAIEELLPASLTGHVLITSRRSEWPVRIAEVPMDVLSEGAAVEFLLARTGQTDREAAGVVARGLGYLPLALEQAAAYVRRHHVDYVEYQARLAASRAKLLEEGVTGATGYRSSVAETWGVTEQQVGVVGRALLRLMAFLGPEEIPRAMFAGGDKIMAEAVQLLGKKAGEKGSNGEANGEVEEGLVELAEYSLIKLTPTAMACHRLVQAVQADRVKGAARGQWVKLTLRLVNGFAPYDADDVRTWKVWEALQPHAECIVRLAEREGIEEPTARLMNQLGLYLNARALYDEAEPMMRRAQEIDEKSYGPDHPKVGTAVNNLAQLLQATNRLREAEPLMQRGLVIFRTFGDRAGHEHPNLRAGARNYQSLLIELKYSKATIERKMRKVLGATERTGNVRGD